MNHTNDTNDKLVDEQEWELQERATQAALDRRIPSTDPAMENYRRVAVALRCAPHDQPPPGFAAAMARQVAQHDAGLERLLFRGLAMALAASSIGVTAVYGGLFWQAVTAISGAGAMQWIAAGAGCVILSWTFGLLRQSAAIGTRAAVRID